MIKNAIKDAIYVDEEEDVLVGWPPVKSWMKKFCQQNHRQCTADNYITVENGSGSGGGGGGRGSTSMYVKVKMEGIGIARKVDLSIHHSYQSLTATLVAMFGKCQENVKMYKLTYQDREGDWLLAGDVPWEYVDEEEDVLVGWPPVKSWMKKFCQQNHRQCTADNYITVENGSGSGGGGGGRGSTSMYVKVKMEGIGIARKKFHPIRATFKTAKQWLLIILERDLFRHPPMWSTEFSVSGFLF
ncbi:hypothetical protein Pfo_000533 [Paulownia fortunei]|nr:hypothetical protein Pfo_000533 [Paulownia fortunei]